MPKLMLVKEGNQSILDYNLGLYTTSVAGGNEHGVHT